ncbi:MAG: carboxy terminal-processing peptidase [Proteobacteria bacterium]|jgi:carboxyl-terminal processing protease|nr:carboxy terminal-processing peptidase [Pseudomonadota bacterium]MBT6193985.1 carboxy terminal-processing peptidase [Pseudomonadota bacterium]MBT6465202.1 carboxy terminal-processing peptidase [Pseudomonadota bacterium]MBT6675250.1 carboxy terminal-processing peptidase [Pseudomonadota bacterium]MBT7626410.1 carboxy terminal-processing peptidase [Pseudomonadota bacterium]
MKKKSAIGFLSLALLSFSNATLAEAPIVAEESLRSSLEHGRASKIVTYVLGNYHYEKTLLNDKLSEKILDQYIKMLDPQRTHFLKTDIDSFSLHKHLVDDYLKKPDLDPMFNIFKTFRKRLENRISFSLSQLDNTFEFKSDESLIIDRSEENWATNVVQLNNIWRKKVKNDVLSLRLAGKGPDEIKSKLQTRYKGALRRAKQLTSDDVFQTVINSFTRSVDPHSTYFSPRQSENFRIRMSLSLEGIGAILQSENELTLIKEIVTGGPADLTEALFPSDRIVGIGQGESGPIVDVVGWRLDDVVDLIRGPKQSLVRLEVLRKGSSVGAPTDVVSITRDTIKLEDQAAKQSVLNINNKGVTSKIGVITIPTFYLDFDARSRGVKNYRSTTRDVQELITELVKAEVEGILIDLRSNGGGSLSEATALTGLFIDYGPVVQVKDSRGRISAEKDDKQGFIFKGPLGVLVDRHSASASEIFAGAMQDYNRAVLIGEATFGKGTVQNLVDLNGFDKSMKGKLGELKTTIAKFFRVNGESTQHRGVIPDVIFPIPFSSKKYGERSLDNALAWEAIKPATYLPMQQNDLRLKKMSDLHSERVKTNKAFQSLIAIEKLIEETRNDKIVSLMESVRDTRYSEGRLNRRLLENKIRVFQGREPLTTDFESIAENTSKEPNDEIEKYSEEFDVLLNEAAAVVNDWAQAHK